MSEVKKVEPYNKPAKRTAKARKSVDPLLLGYDLSQINGQLYSYPKYVTIADEGTEEDIKRIKSGLGKDEFKFAPIFYKEEHGNYTVTHWCCGVITCDEIYVFDPTLQTQKNKTEKGMLKIGDTECEITYLNHGKQIQNNEGKICGPCVVAFAQEIAELNSIQKVLDVCRKGDIFKNAALKVYNKLKNKSSARSQFTNEYYYNMVTSTNEHHDKTIGNEVEVDKTKEKQTYEENKTEEEQKETKSNKELQKKESNKEGDKTKENKQEEEKGFGTVFSKNLNKDRIPLFKSLSQLTPVKEGINEIKTPETEAVEEIRVSIRRSRSVPVIASSHEVLNIKDLKNKGRYRD